MKKIVALVLSLVMVLGLATVASAATYSEDAEYYVTADKQNWDTVKFVPADEEDGAGNVAYFDGSETYVECKKSDDGAVKLFSGKEAGDTLLGYVKVAPVSYSMKGEKVAASAKVNCDTDLHAKGFKYTAPDGAVSYWVEVEKGQQYTNMLVNGEVKYVLQDNPAVLGGHILNLNKTAFLDDAETTREYKCVRCGAVFQGVTTKVAGVEYTAYEPTVALKDAYEDAGYDVSKAVMTDLYLIKAAAPVVDTDKVESAQTFDAGIAMYVGMSVMAAAGSAVVLKKKD